MTEEEIVIEASEEEVNYEAEIEALKANLVLRDAEIAEFKAAEEAKQEEARQTLVESATDLGMKGHEDFSSETLETLIASWKESHVEVEMKPVETGATIEATTEEVAVEKTNGTIKANFLNQKIVETPEAIYAKGWNAWANAWNRTLAASEKDRMRAPLYEQAKEMI